MENPGWIKLHRSILEWEFWKNANVLRLFIYCMLKVNAKNKICGGVTIEKGSFITSLEHLSKETGLTIMQVRYSIDKLKKSGVLATNLATNLATKLSTGCTVITICNYDSYQSGKKVFSNKSNNRISSGISNNEEYILDKSNIIIKEEIDTIVSTKTFSFRDGLIELGVDAQVADDWMLIRSAKKAKDTPTALKHVRTAISELGKQGWSPTEVISACVAQGWYGCNASYFKKLNRSDYTEAEPDDSNSNAEIFFDINGNKLETPQ